MGEFRYVPPDEMARAHRARTAEAPARQHPPRQHQTKNIDVVLSLGDVRYFVCSSGMYRIRPVPFKLGQQVLEAHLRVIRAAAKVAQSGMRAPTDEYYRTVNRLTTLLWKHIQPKGKIMRVLWRLGLLRNPFRNASEREIKEVTDFFLQCRMTSSVRPMSETEAS